MRERKNVHKESCKYFVDLKLREGKFTINDQPEENWEHYDVGVILQWSSKTFLLSFSWLLLPFIPEMKYLIGIPDLYEIHQHYFPKTSWM